MDCAIAKEMWSARHGDVDVESSENDAVMDASTRVDEDSSINLYQNCSRAKGCPWKHHHDHFQRSSDPFLHPDKTPSNPFHEA